MNQRLKVLAGSAGVAVLSLSMTVGAMAHGTGVDLSNILTGAQSNNESNLLLHRFVSRMWSEHNFVWNDVHGKINTGGNSAKMNTDGGKVATGDVDFGGTLVSMPSSSVGPVIELGDLFHAHSKNAETGYASNNEGNIHVSSATILSVDRDSYFNNDVNTKVNTGYNAADKNTKGGSVSSGDVHGDVDVVNKSSASMAGSILVDTGGAMVDFQNKTTGALSNNENNLDLNKEVIVKVDESTYVDNDISSKINTGRNSSSYNTVGGKVSTGDVHTDTNVENVTTSVAPVIVTTGSPTVVDASNAITGYASDNQNNVKISDATIVDVQKSTKIKNDLKVKVNTGENESSFNTVGGEVRTGDASVDFTVVNH